MKNKIQVKDRFILEALRSTGYDMYSAIYELIDNSIDAKSSIIKINHDKENKTLTITDNGVGMSYETLDEAMNLGCDRTYSTNEIGYFGVGMKSSCLNLLELENEKPTVKILTNNGVEKTIVIWEPLTSPMDYEISVYEGDLEIGTSIIVEGIKNFSTQILKKNSGVIFYPTLKAGLLKIFVNNSEIEFNDPLYRNSEKSITNFVSASVLNNEINIECSLIDQSQEKHSWDRKESGDESDEKWSYSKGGLYFVYGGRYIEYGGTFGVKNNDPWDSRTRIELTIPKELTEEFQIKFNKTNSINFKNNEKVFDVVRKVKDMFNWAKKKRQEKGENIATEDEKNELKLINDELNKSAEKAGFKQPKTPTTDKKKVEFEVTGKRNKDKKTDDSPKQKKAKIQISKTYEIRTENLGSTNCFWSLGYENNVFIITLNESHVFYREIYRNMNASGKKDMIFLLASMAYAEYETKIAESSVSEEFFWEDYWSQVSLRLKRLITL